MFNYKVPPLPLRPLVSLSALALLGWCWYSFRRRRRTLLCQLKEEEIARVQSLMEGLVEQEAATDGSGSSQDVHRQEMVSLSSCASSDLDWNPEEPSDCSHVSSSVFAVSVLPGASPAIIAASSPIPRPLKGDGPEPEGKFWEAQASAPVAGKLGTQMERECITPEGHPHSPANERPESDANCSVQQPSKTVCPREQEHPSLPESQSEKAVEQRSYSLVKEATAEILAIGDISLKGNDQEEPGGTLMIDVQTPARSLRDISKKERSPVIAGVEEYNTFIQAVVEGASSAGSLNDQSLSPSMFHAGEDSGYSTCHSEDVAGAKEASSTGVLWSDLVEEGAHSSISFAEDVPYGVEGRDGNLSERWDEPIEGASNVTCMYGESRLDSSESALTLWDLEVPARLVGRLIGKQGKYIDFLKQTSGAKIHVSSVPYTDEFQICHIEGSEVQVENALALIRMKFRDLDLSNQRCHGEPLPSLPISPWLQLPQDSPVEVIVPRVEAANYLFVQQHTHPTYHALHSLNEQMLFCYSRPGCPSLPTPVEAGVVCAAPSADGGWRRAQVMHHYEDSDTVQIRYVDYGGYVTASLSSLRQIRSDFVAVPFQGTEVMLENIAPLPGKMEFSLEAKEALEELTRGVPLIMKVTGSQWGLPLVHMWRQTGEEMVSVNGLLVECGLCSWLESHSPFSSHLTFTSSVSLNWASPDFSSS